VGSGVGDSTAEVMGATTLDRTFPAVVVGFVAVPAAAVVCLSKAKRQRVALDANTARSTYAAAVVFWGERLRFGFAGAAHREKRVPNFMLPKNQKERKWVKLGSKGRSERRIS
jgi:hypothetical protein